MEKLVETMRRIVREKQFQYVDNFTGAIVPRDLVRLPTEIEEEIEKRRPAEENVVEVDGVKMNPVVVDASSANAFLTVYDALKPENQANLLSVNLVWAMDIVWKLIEKSRSRARS